MATRYNIDVCKLWPKGVKIATGIFLGNTEKRYAQLGENCVYDKVLYEFVPGSLTNAEPFAHTYSVSDYVTTSKLTHGNGATENVTTFVPSTFTIPANYSTSEPKSGTVVVTQYDSALSAACGASSSITWTQKKDYPVSVALTLSNAADIEPYGGSVNTCSKSVKVTYKSGSAYTVNVDGTICKVEFGTAVSAGTLGTTEKIRTKIGDLGAKVTYTLNGHEVSASTSIAVYQKVNKIESVSITNVTVRDIPASGGTIGSYTSYNLKATYSSESTGNVTTTSETYGTGVSGSSLEKTPKARTIVGQLSLTAACTNILLEGKSATTIASVFQEANSKSFIKTIWENPAITSFAYADIIPAIGGSVTPSSITAQQSGTNYYVWTSTEPETDMTVVNTTEFSYSMATDSTGVWTLVSSGNGQISASTNIVKADRTSPTITVTAKGPNSGLTGTATATVTQKANEAILDYIVWTQPYITTYSYGSIHASGGSITPTLVAEQSGTAHYNLTDGGTETGETSCTVTATYSMTNNTRWTLKSTSTGEVSANTMGSTSYTTGEYSPSITVTVKGESGSTLFKTASTTVLQDANTSTALSTEWKTPYITSFSYTPTIHASGGTASPSLTAGQSGITNYSWTSNATSTGKTTADATAVTASYEMTDGEGFSIGTNNKVTAKSRGTNISNDGRSSNTITVTVQGYSGLSTTSTTKALQAKNIVVDTSNYSIAVTGKTAGNIPTTGTAKGVQASIYASKVQTLSSTCAITVDEAYVISAITDNTTVYQGDVERSAGAEFTGDKVFKVSAASNAGQTSARTISFFVNCKTNDSCVEEIKWTQNADTVTTAMDYNVVVERSGSTANIPVAGGDDNKRWFAATVTGRKVTHYGTGSDVYGPWQNITASVSGVNGTVGPISITTSAKTPGYISASDNNHSLSTRTDKVRIYVTNPDENAEGTTSKEVSWTQNADSTAYTNYVVSWSNESTGEIASTGGSVSAVLTSTVDIKWNSDNTLKETVSSSSTINATNGTSDKSSASNGDTVTLTVGNNTGAARDCKLKASLDNQSATVTWTQATGDIPVSAITNVSINGDVSAVGGANNPKTSADCTVTMTIYYTVSNPATVTPTSVSWSSPASVTGSNLGKTDKVRTYLTSFTATAKYNGLTAEAGSVDVYQQANTHDDEWNIPVITSVSYPAIHASGETVSPSINASQNGTRRWTSSCASTLSNSTFKYDYELTSGGSVFTLDSENGNVEAGNRTTFVGDELAGIVSVTATDETHNLVSTAKTGVVKQNANAIITYENPVISVAYANNIPSSGGSVSATTLTASQDVKYTSTSTATTYPTDGTWKFESTGDTAFTVPTQTSSFVSANANPGNNNRSGSIKVTYTSHSKSAVESVNIVQNGAISISPVSSSHAASGGSTYTYFKVISDTPWEISNNAEYFTLTTSAGTGNDGYVKATSKHANYSSAAVTDYVRVNVVGNQSISAQTLAYHDSPGQITVLSMSPTNISSGVTTNLTATVITNYDWELRLTNPSYNSYYNNNIRGRMTPWSGTGYKTLDVNSTDMSSSTTLVFTITPMNGSASCLYTTTFEYGLYEKSKTSCKKTNRITFVGPGFSASTEMVWTMEWWQKSDGYWDVKIISGEGWHGTNTEDHHPVSWIFGNDNVAYYNKGVYEDEEDWRTFIGGYNTIYQTRLHTPVGTPEQGVLWFEGPVFYPNFYFVYDKMLYWGDGGLYYHHVYTGSTSLTVTSPYFKVGSSNDHTLSAGGEEGYLYAYCRYNLSQSYGGNSDTYIWTNVFQNNGGDFITLSNGASYTKETVDADKGWYKFKISVPTRGRQEGPEWTVAAIKGTAKPVYNNFVGSCSSTSSNLKNIRQEANVKTSSEVWGTPVLCGNTLVSGPVIHASGGSVHVYGQQAYPLNSVEYSPFNNSHYIKRTYKYTESFTSNATPQNIDTAYTYGNEDIDRSSYNPAYLEVPNSGKRVHELESCGQVGFKVNVGNNEQVSYSGTVHQNYNRLVNTISTPYTGESYTEYVEGVVSAYSPTLSWTWESISGFTGDGPYVGLGARGPLYPCDAEANVQIEAKHWEVEGTSSETKQKVGTKFNDIYTSGSYERYQWSDIQVLSREFVITGTPYPICASTWVADGVYCLDSPYGSVYRGKMDFSPSSGNDNFTTFLMTGFTDFIVDGNYGHAVDIHGEVYGWEGGIINRGYPYECVLHLKDTQGKEVSAITHQMFVRNNRIISTTANTGGRVESAYTISSTGRTCGHTLSFVPDEPIYYAEVPASGKTVGFTCTAKHIAYTVETRRDFTAVTSNAYADEYASGYIHYEGGVTTYTSGASTYVTYTNKQTVSDNVSYVISSGNTSRSTAQLARVRFNGTEYSAVTTSTTRGEIVIKEIGNKTTKQNYDYKFTATNAIASSVKSEFSITQKKSEILPLEYQPYGNGYQGPPVGDPVYLRDESTGSVATLKFKPTYSSTWSTSMPVAASGTNVDVQMNSYHYFKPVYNQNYQTVARCHVYCGYTGSYSKIQLADSAMGVSNQWKEYTGETVTMPDRCRFVYVSDPTLTGFSLSDGEEFLPDTDSRTFTITANFANMGSEYKSNQTSATFKIVNIPMSKNSSVATLNIGSNTSSMTIDNVTTFVKPGILAQNATEIFTIDSDTLERSVSWNGASTPTLSNMYTVNDAGDDISTAIIVNTKVGDVVDVNLSWFGYSLSAKTGWVWRNASDTVGYNTRVNAYVGCDVMIRNMEHPSEILSSSVTKTLYGDAVIERDVYRDYTLRTNEELYENGPHIKITAATSTNVNAHQLRAGRWRITRNVNGGYGTDGDFGSEYYKKKVPGHPEYNAYAGYFLSSNMTRISKHSSNGVWPDYEEYQIPATGLTNVSVSGNVYVTCAMTAQYESKTGVKQPDVTNKRMDLAQTSGVRWTDGRGELILSTTSCTANPCFRKRIVIPQYSNLANTEFVYTSIRIPQNNGPYALDGTFNMSGRTTNVGLVANSYSGLTQAAGTAHPKLSISGHSSFGGNCYSQAMPVSIIFKEYCEGEQGAACSITDIPASATTLKPIQTIDLPDYVGLCVSGVTITSPWPGKYEIKRSGSSIKKEGKLSKGLNVIYLNTDMLPTASTLTNLEINTTCSNNYRFTWKLTRNNGQGPYNSWKLGYACNLHYGYSTSTIDLVSNYGPELDGVTCYDVYPNGVTFESAEGNGGDLYIRKIQILYSPVNVGLTFYLTIKINGSTVVSERTNNVADSGWMPGEYNVNNILLQPSNVIEIDITDLN